jgi:hypothetical protein
MEGTARTGRIVPPDDTGGRESCFFSWRRRQQFGLVRRSRPAAEPTDIPSESGPLDDDGDPMKTPVGRTRFLILLLTATTLTAGCATTGRGELSKDEYKTVFSNVIRKTIDDNKTNNLCLPNLFGYGPVATESVEVNLDNDAINRGAQMRALESVGLVTSSESVRTIANKPTRFATYRRTELGKTYFSVTTFCYARAEFEAVTKWKGPVALGDYRAAFVYYTTKTGTIADWARSPAVVAAFPTVAAIVNGEKPKVRQVVIDLSSEGWDVAEYSKLVQLE